VDKKYMKISELSQQSGVPIPRIRYYIRSGILFQPIKVNKTQALYTLTHLDRLNVITQLHEQKKMSVPAMKKLLKSGAERKINKEYNEVNATNILRDQIIDLSVEVFRKKGYERATIDDITKGVGTSRNTFYLFFKNKKELFIACLSKLFMEWRREAPDTNTPLFSVMKQLSLAHYKVYPRWSDMMNMFRAAATKYPEEFADRLEESLSYRMKYIVEDVKRGIDQGELRGVDPELAAIAIAGQLDYVCYFLTRGKFGKNEPSAVINQLFDMVFHGIKKK